jgi:hypothetical protein
MKKLLLATLAAATLLGSVPPAYSDALGNLIQFRTVEHGETCSRHETFGICTLGKSTEFRAVYLAAPDIYSKVGTSAAAQSLCAKLKKDGFESFTANFVKYEGEVILNCVLRKAAKP